MRSRFAALLLGLSFLAFPLQPTSAQPSPADIARRLLLQQNDQAAIDTLTQADSLGLDGYFLLGRAYQSLFTHQRAAAAFAQADTTQPHVLATWGQSLRQLGRLPEARLRYRQAYRRDSTNRSIALPLADLYAQANEWSSAYQILAPLVARNSQNPLLHARLARTYQAIDSTRAAIRHYRRAFALNPSSVPVPLRLSGLYAKSDSLDVARTVIETALESHAREATLWKQRGHLALKASDHSEAIRSYQAAVHLGDSSAATLRNLGKAHFLSDDYETAVPLLRQAFQADTTHAGTAFYLGMAQKHIGRADSSITYLKRATRLFGQSTLADVYEQMADAYKQNRAFERAIEVDRLALKLNPDKPAVLFHLATLYDDYYADPKPALTHYRLFLRRTGPGAFQQMQAYARHRMQVLGERDFFRRPPDASSKPTTASDTSQ